ncbi:MAG: homoserine dehydrogenase [Phycisphaerae bacterium]|nr:homoserine dehydrogenase [Phycisphaerae bacterium]
MRSVGIGLIGCGTIGKGVVELLTRNAETIARKTGLRLELRHVCEINRSVWNSITLPSGRFTADLNDILNDPETNVAIELIGGTTVAGEVVKQCLAAGKDVVTANKALLAIRGKEMFAAARAAGQCIVFEASVGGGIPLLSSLREGLIANRIDALFGIVNGTCNYILSEMATHNRAYADVLEDAKRLGYAEPDPTLDVNGTDTAHKLAILAAMAFQADIDFATIPIEGIQAIDRMDLHVARELGYACKLLAIGERNDDGISLRVHPAFIRATHPLASVSGPFNAVSVYGNAVGHCLLYGRGAGPAPTASAIVADVIAAATGNARRTFEQFQLLQDQNEPAIMKPIDAIQSRYYVRAMVKDQPNVMAQITRIFGERAISLSAITQHEAEADAPQDIVPVAITTHMAREGAMREAIKEIEKLDVITAPCVCIRVVAEHEEFKA